MRLNIIDQNTLEWIGVLSQYASVQWSPTYNTTDGSFEIVCGIEYIDLLKIDTYVENTAALDHVGVIKRIQTSKENGATVLTVSGIMLEYEILRTRVIRAHIVYHDQYPTKTILNLLGLTLINPADPNRKLKTLGNVIMPADKSVPDMEKANYSSNYANLDEEIYSLLEVAGLGVKARINHNTKKIDVEFYIGNDLTFGGDEPIVLSAERGTILSSIYAKDASQNVNYLIGIGEDNLLVEMQRERVEGEPLIEKSVDFSSEVPWPTFNTEVEDEVGEDGTVQHNGSYYQYNKYSPSGDFITNRDVWEKYAVERIETQETRYREVEIDEEVIDDVDGWLEDNPEILSDVTFDEEYGYLADSYIDTETSLDNAYDNLDYDDAELEDWDNFEYDVGSYLEDYEDVSLYFGQDMPSLFAADTSVTEDSVVIYTDKAVSPSTQTVTPYNESTKETDTTAALQTITSLPIKASLVSGKSAGPALSSQDLVSGKSVLNRVVVRKKATPMTLAESDETETPPAEGETEVEVVKKQTRLEEYQETIVTYKVGEFIEYKYVNKGASPSFATKIVQGSVESGSVMFYENFRDVRIAEEYYRHMLERKAEEYLKKLSMSETLEVTPYHLSSFVYGQSYNLGDIVTAQDKEVGYAVDLRVTGATEVWDSNGYSIAIEVGESVPSLTNRIKLLSKGG